MENNKGKFEENIMSRIRSGKVKLRSRYIFLAEKLGMESAFALSVILSILFANLFFFYLKSTDNIEYLSFGSDGIYAFLESFPYLLIIAFIIFILVSGYLLSKTDFSYKKPFKFFLLSLLTFVFVSGGVLAYTDLSERIEEEAFNEGSSSFIMKPFLRRGVELRKTGLSGKILEISRDYFVIETPNGFQKVDIKNLGSEIGQFSNGQFIIIIGERKEDVFAARRIRIVGEENMQMIRRGIHRHSNRNLINTDLNNNGFIIQGIELKECMDDCLMLKETRRQCFDGCVEN
jgi:hypothetical protein